MKNIYFFMLCIPMYALGADKELKRDINIALITHHLPYDTQLMRFLNSQSTKRLPVFTEITQQRDQPAAVVTKLPTPAFPISHTQVISQPRYVIPPKRSDAEKDPKQDRKKDILSFITLKNTNARKSFKDGYTLYNNKGMIAETRKQGSRSFSAKDVSRVIVHDDLTIDILLKSDILKK